MNCKIFNNFKKIICIWNDKFPELKNDISAINNKERKNTYEILNPIVFNDDLLLCGQKGFSQIKLIVVGDNPGKKEQEQSRYFSGSAGKTLKTFISEKLRLDVKKEVIFINKTPIHTCKTNELSKLIEHSSLIKRTQKYMAKLVFKTHRKCNCDVWILGASNLKGDSAIFKEFKEAFVKTYRQHPDLYKNVYVFSHTSNGHFELEFYRKFYEYVKESQTIPVEQHILRDIGSQKKQTILG